MGYNTKYGLLKHKSISVWIVAILMVLLVSVFFSVQVNAGQPDCGGIDTSFDYGCPDADPESGEVEDSPIFHLLLVASNILAAGVGIAVVGAITWGAIKYSSSDGSPEKVKEGISWITNAVIGLLLFLAMYALINFLVPGGLFSQNNSISGSAIAKEELYVYETHR